MTAPDPRLGEIAARVAAASEGPWGIDADDFDGYAVFMDDGITWGRAYVCNGLNQGESEGKADAEFIANAPADIAYLLAALADRDAKLAEVTDLIGWLDAASADDEPLYAKGKVSARATAERLRAAVADTTGGEAK